MGGRGEGGGGGHLTLCSCTIFYYPVFVSILTCPQDRESCNEMLGYLRTISVSSSKLLLAAKALSADPNAPNVMNQLAAAARALTDAINSLLDLCSTSGPGQKECDNALRNIEVRLCVLGRVREGGGLRGRQLQCITH